MSLTVARSGSADTARLSELLERHPPAAWVGALGLEAAAALRWRVAELADAAARGEGARDAGRLVTAEADGELVGAVAIHRLDWEPAIYGVEMARIPAMLALGARAPSGESGGRPGPASVYDVARALLAAAQETFAAWGTRHASAIVPAELTALHHALESAGWRLVDSTLEFAWEAGRTSPGGADPRVLVRPIEPADREPLRALARAAYAGAIRTRWSADPWLPLAGAGELYARWFDAACDGAFGDHVGVALLDGRPIGFNTLKLDRGLSDAVGVGIAAHGIAAVDPAARGHGAQPALLHDAAEWVRARGGRFARGRVLVQNLPMQHACLKAGGFVTQALHTFHTWLGGGRA